METECYLQEDPPAWCCVSLTTSRVLMWGIASVNLVFGVAMIALGLVSNRVPEMIEIKDPRVVYILEGILIGQGVAIVFGSVTTHVFIRTANIGKLYGVAGVVSFVLLLQVTIFLLARYFMHVLMNIVQTGISNCEVCKAYGDADIILTHVRPAVIISGVGCVSTAFQLSLAVGIKNHFLKMLHRERRRRMNKAFHLTPSYLHRAGQGYLQDRASAPLLQHPIVSDVGHSEMFDHLETRFTSTPIAVPQPLPTNSDCTRPPKSPAPTICLYYEEELRKGQPNGAGSMLRVTPACSPRPGASGVQRPRQSSTHARYLSPGGYHLAVPGANTKGRNHPASSLRYGKTLHPKSGQGSFQCKGGKWRGVSASSSIVTPTGSKGSVSSMLAKQAQVKNVRTVQIPQRSVSARKHSGKVLRPPSYTAYPPNRNQVKVKANSCTQAVYYPFAHVAPIQRIHSSTTERVHGIFKYCPPNVRNRSKSMMYATVNDFRQYQAPTMY